MHRLSMLFVTLAALACATTPQPRTATTSAADRDAIVAAVQAVFDAMRTRDTIALKAAFTPDAQLVSIRTVPGAPARVQTQPLAAFMTSVGRAREELVETMWDPRVDVAGDIASLWAPYDFRIGANFSHCGHDAVHLVRTESGWKITAITYTVVTTGCAAR